MQGSDCRRACQLILARRRKKRSDRDVLRCRRRPPAELSTDRLRVYTADLLDADGRHILKTVGLVMAESWSWPTSEGFHVLLRITRTAGPRTRRRYERHWPRSCLDGAGRLLDVGCGPGILAIELAPLFSEVIGLDPESGMLAEGRRRADEPGDARCAGSRRWPRTSRNSLSSPAGLSRSDSPSIGLDCSAVTEVVYDLLEPGGAIVLVSQTGRGPSAVRLDRTCPISPTPR